MKSPLKYIGGKAKLINNKSIVFPQDFNDYYEPFCGGLSPFLNLISNNKVSFLSDNSENLINFYSVVKYRINELITELETNPYFINTKTNYILCRKIYNEIKILEQPIQKAALFLFLNKTGFNGMYRENKKGEYNIPFGKMKSPNWCDKITLFYLHKKLNSDNVYLTCQDYSKINPKKNDLVYLDPPYYNTFSGYSKNTFGKQKHLDLFLKCIEWKSLGIHVILSNSDDPFILELYKDFEIIKIPINYSINPKCKNSKFELLIKF